jgi:broad specificity phosphatase PhoE
MLQAQRLAAHLASTDVKISHIFSSDLQRAFNTAEAVRSAQSLPPPETTKLEILREQDFGFYEGKHYFERPRNSNKSGRDAHLDAHRDEPGFKDVESKAAMVARMDTFVDGHLLSLFEGVAADTTVVVVAHGIILSYLWRAILKRFHPVNVHVLPGATIGDTGRGLEHLGGWSNTGYLDIDVRRHSDTSPAPETDEIVPIDVLPTSTAERLPETFASTTATEQPAVLTLPPPTKADSTQSPQSSLKNMSLVIKTVNSQVHLRGLKKTRGGIGSLKHDSSQKTVDSFFTKQRTE